MSTERVLLVFGETSEAMEDVMLALGALKAAPWKPNPPGERFGAPQERYTDAEVDEYVLTILRRSSARLSFGGSVIVP